MDKNKNKYTNTNTNTNTDKDYIILNGPINCIKLFNHETDQTVWLFMDYHYPINYQHKCEEYEAKDIDKYLYKIYKETTEVIDFLFEINPSKLNLSEELHENKIYISRVEKIFKKAQFDTQINKNIRLHFVDIRSHTFTHDIYYSMKNILNNLEMYKLDNLNNIIEELNKIVRILESINKLIENISDMNINTDVGANVDKLKKLKKLKKNKKNEINIETLLEKILLDYDDLANKQNVTNYFYLKYYDESKIIINFINNLVGQIKTINDLFDYQLLNENLNIVEYSFGGTIRQVISYGINDVDYNNKFSDFKRDLIFLDIQLINLGTVFMDCFFLRRITQKKNFIKKAIVYTGSFHTIVYIWFLIKYNNFKIVDSNYINKKKLNNKNTFDHLENIIKKSDNYDNLFEIFYPKKINQCVKIKNIK